eukprot:scaffold4134_cov74-Cylindrotheca_fusiformis.AAC.2
MPGNAYFFARGAQAPLYDILPLTKQPPASTIVVADAIMISINKAQTSMSSGVGFYGAVPGCTHPGLKGIAVSLKKNDIKAAIKRVQTPVHFPSCRYSFNGTKKQVEQAQ